MFTNLQAISVDQIRSRRDFQENARKAASKFFDRAHSRGVRGRLYAKLTGKINSLQTLSYCPKNTRKAIGVITVPLSKIIGTESRSEDFDKNFNPLKKHNRERWINITVAYWMGVALPAVELIQIGSEYYVRDGHHRISVAKFMGQLDIEAQIVN